MARWLVKLEGEASDLEEFPRRFPDGDLHAIDEDGSIYLTGHAFERFPEAGQVHEAARQALHELGAVIALLWPSLRRPSLGYVIREEDGDRKRHFFLECVSVEFRAKLGASLSVNGEEPVEQRPTQAQQLLAGSRADAHLAAALSLWSDPPLTWSRLHRILEEVEAGLRAKVCDAGLCSDNQRERFTRTANSAEAAGKDARHRLGKFVPPKNPMDLAEATSFIAGLLEVALRRAAAAPGATRPSTP